MPARHLDRVLRGGAGRERWLSAPGPKAKRKSNEVCTAGRRLVLRGLLRWGLDLGGDASWWTPQYFSNPGRGKIKAAVSGSHSLLGGDFGLLFLGWAPLGAPPAACGRVTHQPRGLWEPKLPPGARLPNAVCATLERGGPTGSPSPTPPGPQVDSGTSDRSVANPLHGSPSRKASASETSCLLTER